MNSMDIAAERMRILEMIEAGRISAAEGVRLLEALSGADDSSNVIEAFPGSLEAETLAEDPFATQSPLESEFEVVGPQKPGQDYSYDPHRGSASSLAVEEAEFVEPPLDFDTARYRGWWIYLLWIGLGMALLGGALAVAAVLAAGAVSIWFLCALSPFALGVLVLAFGWMARKAAWLHLRVQQAPGEKPERIALSFPLPIGPAAWLLDMFGDFIPGNRRQTLEQVLFALRSGVGPDNPIHIQVDEGDGEKVEIYIG